jgi:hypothetical protein
MIYDGNVNDAQRLVQVAKKVISKGSSIRHEAFEKRVHLWNEIKQNQEKYDNDEHGRILDAIDTDYRAKFDYALLIIARSFIETGDDFPPSNIFSSLELEIYEKIQRYDVFEISTKEDIKKRVIAKDDILLDLFKEYYLEMDSWVDKTLYDHNIRLTLRYYLKKTWESYKKKINDALNDLIRDYDWFRVLVQKWEQKQSTSSIPEPAEIQKPKDTEEEGSATVDDEETGARFINLGEAKMYENTFIGRIRNKLQTNLSSIDKKLKLETINEYSNSDPSNYMNNAKNVSLQNIPENKYIIARMVQKKWFKKKKILVKAIYMCRTKRYVTKGIDTFPLDLEDINPIISDAAQASMDGKMLLCIGSPTGFSDKLKDHISGKEFHKNYLSTVSLCLIDVETGTIIYNPHDTTIKQFKDIFIPETDEELFAKAKRQAKQNLIESGGVRLDDFIKRYGYSSQIAKKAFYDLVHNDGYNVEYRKEFGTLWLWRE